MNKIEDLLNVAKLTELLHKKEEEQEKKNTILIVVAVLAAVTAMHDPVIPIVANSDKSYVSSINNLSEKNVGPQSGWTYRVNGVLPMMAANQYTVKDGDVIKWIYVCQLGDK